MSDKEDGINQEQRMWRTLVRVKRKLTAREDNHGVWLIIPGWSTKIVVWCPRKAIPPHIFEGMEVDKRYHVKCNIGAAYAEELCFDEWENE